MIVDVNKVLATIMLLAAAAMAAPPKGVNEALAQVKTVYVLPMSYGMDQYVASRLTREGVLQVVTDPGKADALITDHLGESFEAKVKELYPALAPKAGARSADQAGDRQADEVSDAGGKDVAPKDSAKDGAKKDTAKKDEAPKDAARKDDVKKDEDVRPSDPMGLEFDVKPMETVRVTPSSVSRGTLFLVKRGTWEVLWSGYRQPGLRRGRELEETAGRLVNSLKRAIDASTAKPDGK